MKTIQSIALSIVLPLHVIPLSAQADDLNVEMMKATFKLSNEKSTATAFLFDPSNGTPSKKGQFILVTAAHVFEKMTGDEATLFVRRQESEGVYKKVPVTLPIGHAGKNLWTRHPTEDVAAMHIHLPQGVDMPNLPFDLFATDDTMKTYDIHPGDNLTCLGYPHRVEANEAGFAILRHGALASFPLLPTKVNKTFLVSVNTFEGDSGLIVGLVIGQHFLDEEAKLIYGTTRFRHRLGLAIVVAAPFIMATIERFPN